VALIRDIQAETGLSLIFIRPRSVGGAEIGPPGDGAVPGPGGGNGGGGALYADPLPSLYRALLSAVPVPDPKVERQKKRVLLTGDLPSPLDRRAQLNFLKSKRIDDPDAEQYRPQLLEVMPGHLWPSMIQLNA